MATETKTAKQLEEKDKYQINESQPNSRSSEPKKGKNKLVVGCLVVVAVVVLLICGVATWFFVWLYTGPEGGVKYGYEMEEYATEYNDKNDILESGEEIIAYYDYTVSLDGTESAVLTDKRVLYQKDGDVTSINLEDINDINYQEEDFIGFTIDIAGEDSKRLVIEIAPFNNGQLFLDALLDEWGAAKEPESAI